MKHPGFAEALTAGQRRASELLSPSAEEQLRLGYFHTLHEILQQPSTWLDTCQRMQSNTATLHWATDEAEGMVLTGSGSSEYAGECIRLLLQSELGITVQTIGGGALLTLGRDVMPPRRPATMVSLARSGDSPESTGALSRILDTDPDVRHLVLTCNQDGALAASYSGDPRVRVIALDPRTNDSSLVMTSSFTNMVLAARALGLLDRAEEYGNICECLSRVCRSVFLHHFDDLVNAGKRGFRRAVFLGTGSRWGAARESALKMLEMTEGRVATLYETWLGLRHGPMSFIDRDTIVIGFLSSDPLLRAYETDLLAELDRKQLGAGIVIVGGNVPRALVRTQDILIEAAGIEELREEEAPVIEVVVGQLLAFGRCLEEGLHPDSPSQSGVIQRVVGSFTVHDHRSPTSPK